MVSIQPVEVGVVEQCPRDDRFGVQPLPVAALRRRDVRGPTFRGPVMCGSCTPVARMRAAQDTAALTPGCPANRRRPIGYRPVGRRPNRRRAAWLERGVQAADGAEGGDLGRWLRPARRVGEVQRGLRCARPSGRRRLAVPSGVPPSPGDPAGAGALEIA